MMSSVGPELLEDPSFRSRHQRLLALLRLHAFREREVTLSSGLKSNFYVDCKQVTLDAEGALLIGEVIARLVTRVAPSAVGIGGLTLGADPIATAASICSLQAGTPRHAFIVRKEPKGHGTGEWLEQSATLPAHSPVVIVEDVVTTGASTLRAIERTRAAGHQVLCAIGLVDRLEGGREAVVAQTPLYALYTRKDFLP